MQYTTFRSYNPLKILLFYQDFKDTFVCNTQPKSEAINVGSCCFIRISKILLYAIHNFINEANYFTKVVLSGFQRYFCMQYTTCARVAERNTGCFIRISKILLYAIHNFIKVWDNFVSVVLSGFQRYFCMQYTTNDIDVSSGVSLFYQDFKDTFVCNTQLHSRTFCCMAGCFIRISMNNLLQRY